MMSREVKQPLAVDDRIQLSRISLEASTKVLDIHIKSICDVEAVDEVFVLLKALRSHRACTAAGDLAR
jgi:hypothetical protein